MPLLDGLGGLSRASFSGLPQLDGGDLLVQIPQHLFYQGLQLIEVSGPMRLIITGDQQIKKEISRLAFKSAIKFIGL